MAKLTKAQIEKAIRIKFDFSDEDFWLSKAEGSWYWGGDKVVDFEESCTFNTRLSDLTLEQWVKSFEFDYTQGKRLS